MVYLPKGADPKPDAIVSVMEIQDLVGLPGHSCFFVFAKEMNCGGFANLEKNLVSTNPGMKFIDFAATADKLDFFKRAKLLYHYNSYYGEVEILQSPTRSTLTSSRLPSSAGVTPGRLLLSPGSSIARAIELDSSTSVEPPSKKKK